MRHEQGDDGKFSMSLELKDWFWLIGLIVGATAYVIHIEDTVKQHDRTCIYLGASDSLQTSYLRQHEWRLRRVEKKLRLNSGGGH